MPEQNNHKKNLLIDAHYYVPDTASTGQILKELAEGMLDKFNITVICVVPSYLGTIEEKYKTKKTYIDFNKDGDYSAKEEVEVDEK